jgi:hypothetical protein
MFMCVAWEPRRLAAAAAVAAGRGIPLDPSGAAAAAAFSSSSSLDVRIYGTGCVRGEWRTRGFTAAAVGTPKPQLEGRQDTCSSLLNTTTHSVGVPERAVGAPKRTTRSTTLNGWWEVGTAGMVPDVETPWDTLPDDLLVTVASFLDTPNDLINYTSACHRTLGRGLHAFTSQLNLSRI